MKNEIFYIGSTINPLKIRLSQHVSMCKAKSNTPVHSYINKNNINPAIELIEEVRSMDDCRDIRSMEKYWIEKLISDGASLQNVRYSPDNEPKTQISVSLDEDVILAICAIAKETQRSFSFTANQLLKEILIQKQKINEQSTGLSIRGEDHSETH